MNIKKLYETNHTRTFSVFYLLAFTHRLFITDHIGL